MNKHLLIGISLLILNSCTNIWNAGDLQKWVHKEAIKSGCIPDSIVLDDWYTNIKGENIWYGQCTDSKSVKSKKVAISVDKVWTPSK